jgi:hypothetical protein
VEENNPAVGALMHPLLIAGSANITGGSEALEKAWQAQH